MAEQKKKPKTVRIYADVAPEIQTAIKVLAARRGGGATIKSEIEAALAAYVKTAKIAAV